jgi:hypothetical protein
MEGKQPPCLPAETGLLSQTRWRDSSLKVPHLSIFYTRDGERVSTGGEAKGVLAVLVLGGAALAIAGATIATILVLTNIS